MNNPTSEEIRAFCANMEQALLEARQRGDSIALGIKRGMKDYFKLERESSPSPSLEFTAAIRDRLCVSQAKEIGQQAAALVKQAFDAVKDADLSKMVFLRPEPHQQRRCPVCGNGMMYFEPGDGPGTPWNVCIGCLVGRVAKLEMGLTALEQREGTAALDRAAGLCEAAEPFIGKEWAETLAREIRAIPSQRPGVVPDLVTGDGEPVALVHAFSADGFYMTLCGLDPRPKRRTTVRSDITCPKCLEKLER